MKTNTRIPAISKTKNSSSAGALFFQPKLTVNEPGDIYEREADAVADEVMRMKNFSGEKNFFSPPVVQRKCAACEEEDEKKMMQRKESNDGTAEVFTETESPLKSPGLYLGEAPKRFFSPPLIHRKCAACEGETSSFPKALEHEKEMMQRMQRMEGNDGTTEASAETEDYIKSLSGGRSLSSDERNFFEPALGYEFSNVRLHTDTAANESAENVNALAYTHANDIVFAPGRYQPNTDEGKKLLAHELTHVVQQNSGNISPKFIQCDFAIEPTHPRAVGRTLSAGQVQAAITYNSSRITSPDEISLIRDVIGLARDPAVIDADFINAIARYQAQYGETSDGKIGSSTMARLSQEIRAEGEYLTSGGASRGSLDIAFQLQTQLDGLITAGNTTYADYKTAINAASLLNRSLVLTDAIFMRRLKDTLSWQNFAKSAELLGRAIPNANTLMQNRVVRNALTAAFTDSDAAVTIWDTHDPDPALAADPCNPAPGAAVATTAHEEGGWIYLNLVTGDIATRRAARGAQAGISLNSPVTVTDSVVVATFHTHPNVGACWSTAANPVFPSNNDTTNANNRGVPNIIRGAFPDVATTIDVSTGPAARRHLAGSQLFPGTTGGTAPQANRLGKELDHE